MWLLEVWSEILRWLAWNSGAEGDGGREGGGEKTHQAMWKTLEGGNIACWKPQPMFRLLYYFFFSPPPLRTDGKHMEANLRLRDERDEESLQLIKQTCVVAEERGAAREGIYYSKQIP